MPLRYDKMMFPGGGGRRRGSLKSGFLAPMTTRPGAVPSAQMPMLGAPVASLSEQVQLGGMGSMLTPRNRGLMRGRRAHPITYGARGRAQGLPMPSASETAPPPPSELGVTADDVTPAYRRYQMSQNRSLIPPMPGQIPGGVPMNATSARARGGYDQRAVYDPATDSWRARERGDLTLPGFSGDERTLEQQTSDYVARDRSLQRATAQGQLDPGRYAHITEGPPPTPPRGPIPLPEGTRMSGGSVVANIDGRQVLLPPSMTPGVPFTAEQQAPMGAEAYRQAAIANPSSNIGRSYMAGRTGLAHVGHNRRQRQIMAIAAGREEDPGNLTSMEQRRVDAIRRQNAGVSLPGIPGRVSEERAAQIRDAGVDQRRQAFGLPRIPPAVSDTNVVGSTGIGSPPQSREDVTKAPLVERLKARDDALGSDTMIVMQELGYDAESPSVEDVADIFYENIEMMGDTERGELREYLDSAKAADPDGFGAELDDILERDVNDSGTWEDVGAVNEIRKLYGVEPMTQQQPYRPDPSRPPVGYGM